MLPAADVDGLKGRNGQTFPVSVGLGNFLRPSASFSGRKNDGGEKEREEVTKLLRGLLHRSGAHYTLSYSLAEDAASKGIIGHERRGKQASERGKRQKLFAFPPRRRTVSE